VVDHLDGRVVAAAREPEASERAGGDELEVLAVADLDHEAVGVLEEELVDGRALLLVDGPLHVPDAHLPEPALHDSHVLALEGDVVVHGVQLAGVHVGHPPRVVALDQVDPHPVVEQPAQRAASRVTGKKRVRLCVSIEPAGGADGTVPCAGEVERRRAVDEDEAEGLDVEPDGVLDGLAQAGDMVERHQRHRRHVLVQLRRVGRFDDALRRMTAAAAAFLALFSHGLVSAVLYSSLAGKGGAA
jgi:hypothetical protein